jgi:hypothetical protein
VQAEQFLRRFGRLHTAAAFSAVIDDRAPVEAIVHAAGAADLVVMGTHGRSGPKRWWLGSVAERVLREMARPLLVIRADATAPASGLFDRSVIAADVEADATAIADYSQTLARCLGGHLLGAGHDPIDVAVRRAHATIFIVPAPQPRPSGWLARYGEPLVRVCTVPILFVPVISEGVAS